MTVCPLVWRTAFSGALGGVRALARALVLTMSCLAVCTRSVRVTDGEHPIVVEYGLATRLLYMSFIDTCQCWGWTQRALLNPTIFMCPGVVVAMADRVFFSGRTHATTPFVFMLACVCLCDYFNNAYLNDDDKWYEEYRLR
jgi:hypothetical protein